MEKDTYFHTATVDIRELSKLEGTVHVNVQLIRKFMNNYLFSPAEYKPVDPDFSFNDDTFLFNQGPTTGLGKVQFHDHVSTFNENKGLPNVATFIRQVEIFKELLKKAGPDKMQDKNPSFSLPLGEMFSIVVYGHLILEQARFEDVESDILNQIFDFMVRDFAAFALQIYGNHSIRDEQRSFCKEIMLISAVSDDDQYQRVWKKYVLPLDGEYAMNE